MERSVHIWRYGGCQSAGTLSAGGRIEGAELSADPVRKRGTVFLLPDLSEVETPVPASCPGTGMPGADQSCGERKAGNLVQKEDYQEITDSAWQDAVRDALDGETGLCRTEQSGVAKKRKDNVNRIWNMRQWTTSVYSSAYDTEYQNFRNNVFKWNSRFGTG